MRKLILIILSLAAFNSYAWQPTKVVEVVVPFPVGSSNDLVIRPLLDAVEKNTGVKFIVNNRPGAGGTIGTAYFSKLPNDGHHINVISVGGVAAMDYTWPGMFKNAAYGVNSFAYATALARTPIVIIANKKDTVDNSKDLIDVLIKDPKVVVADSGGAGRLGLESVLINVDIRKKNPNLVRVEHKGPAETVVDIMGGNVRFGSVPLVVAYPHYAAGNLKIVALTQQKKIEGLAISSFGDINKNIDVELVWGIALPKDTASEVVEWYARVFTEAKNDLKIKEYFKKNYFFDVPKELEDPKSFNKYVLDQEKLQKPIVKYIVETTPN